MLTIRSTPQRQAFLDKLGKPRRMKCGFAFRGRCPAKHKKSTPLTVTFGHDRWHLRCHGGCSTETVMVAAGIDPGDLFHGNLVLVCVHFGQ